MLETVLGVTAAAWGILMAISPGLQIRKMLLHRSSHQVSIAYFWVLLVGFTLWIAYGLSIPNWYLDRPECGRVHGLHNDDRRRAALPAQTGAGR